MTYLTQLLHRQLQQLPNAQATVDQDRRRSWSDSVGRISRLAAGLVARGVQPGDRVAVLAHNSDLYHETIFATWWTGAAINPVNTRWSAREIAFSLEDCGSRFLLVDAAFAPLLPQIRELAPGLRQIAFLGDGPEPDQTTPVADLLAHEPVDDLHVGGDALAGVFYTGGTTGHPKGVMLSHANMLCSAMGSLATGEYVVPGGTMLHAAPMFHLAGLSAWLMRNITGGTNVFVASFTPDSLIGTVAQERVTEVCLVPTMLQALLDSPQFASSDLTSLQRVMYGASPISEALQDRLATDLPQVRLTQSYGMTELGPIASTLPHDAHLDRQLRRSAGRATPHSEIRVVDPDGREVPRGTVGEVTVRGGHVMQGYWNRPEETAAVLRDGWMHTADVAWMNDEGYLFIVDRLKDMIITGGENVYSSEVENAIATHPAVAACAVVGIPDDHWGERVHAVITRATGHDLELDELRAHVKVQIAGYKAPRSMTVVDALPLSGAGKVDKRQLRDQVRSLT